MPGTKMTNLLHRPLLVMAQPLQPAIKWSLAFPPRSRPSNGEAQPIQPLMSLSSTYPRSSDNAHSIRFITERAGGFHRKRFNDTLRVDGHKANPTGAELKNAPTSPSFSGGRERISG